MKIDIQFYNIISDRFPESFEGMRMVFLTDLHDRQYDYQNGRLLRWIKGLKPHFVLIGGDMIIGKRSFGDTEDIMVFLERLAKRFPVFYAYGNHEKRLELYEKMYGVRFSLYIHQMKGRGIRILNNSSIYIGAVDNKAVIRDEPFDSEDCIRISGLNMDLEYYNRFWNAKEMPDNYINEKLGASPSCYEILLAHNPEYFDKYADWGADLVLSGHVHGGVVRLPLVGGVFSPDFTLFPKYSAGEYYRGKSEMIVSKGLGDHTIPIRIGNPREISVLDFGPYEQNGNVLG